MNSLDVEDHCVMPARQELGILTKAADMVGQYIVNGEYRLKIRSGDCIYVNMVDTGWWMYHDIANNQQIAINSFVIFLPYIKY